MCLIGVKETHVQGGKVTKNFLGHICTTVSGLKYQKKREKMSFLHHAEKHFGNGLTVFVNQVSTQSQSIFFVVLIMQLSVAEENQFLLHRNYLPPISNTRTHKILGGGGGGGGNVII